MKMVQAAFAGVVTPEWRAVLLADPCVYCQGVATGLDHIHPESRGGEHGWWNRAPACAACDETKRNYSLLSFLLGGQIAATITRRRQYANNDHRKAARRTIRMRIAEQFFASTYEDWRRQGMADTDKATLKKIGLLTDTLRELQAKTYEVTEEIQKLLAGEAGIGEKLRHVERDWNIAWHARYHSDYVPNYTQDRAHIKRLLKTFTPEELQARMLVYIKSQDPFYVSRRHPFAVFVASVNTHVAPPPVNENQLSQKTTEVLAGLGAFVEHEP